MFSKTQVDELICKTLSSLDMIEIQSVKGLSFELCALLNANSDTQDWAWSVGEAFNTKGITNKSTMTFSVVGAYKNTCKILVNVARVLDTPADYLAFPYDLLESCVRIELAITGYSDTRSKVNQLPVVYGVSIGVTDYASYWESADEGHESWSRESFELLRHRGSNFRTVETVIEPDRGNLHNAIYRNKRCHLSFGMDWSISWNNLLDDMRFAYVAPVAVQNPDDVKKLRYEHDSKDSRYVPFLNEETKRAWEAESERLKRMAMKEKALKKQERIVVIEQPTTIDAPNVVLNQKSHAQLDMGKERQQLLHHWRKVNPIGLGAKVEQLIAALQKGDSKGASEHVRKFHDILGYMAKDTPDKGGKCAGCFYRSSRFIALEQKDRCSKKKLATVHLEHLVPVKVLVEKVKVLLDRGASPEVVQRFLLQYSISVGLHVSQGRLAKDDSGGLIRKGLTSKTRAFDRGHEHFGLPFMRYIQREGIDSKIYNVLTGKEMVFETACHDQSRLDVIKVIRESGNALGLIDVATNPDNGYSLLMD